MFKIARREITWGGRPLVIETGKLARQATGAVVVTYGDTMVLCTVVADKTPKSDVDFFPLSVHYQEKAFAAGKIPGGFVKREGRPSEKEVLTSRLIDRPIRPLFPETFLNEVQVICTVLGHDLENDADIPSIIGASAALTLSGIPFFGPVGAARVGMKDGQFILNPSLDDMADSDLDLVVAGTQEGVLMVESEAKELPEDKMLQAVMFGHDAFQPVIDMIIDLAEEAAKEPWDLIPENSDTPIIAKKIETLIGKDLIKAYQEKIKQTRYEIVGSLKQKAMDTLTAEGHDPKLIAKAFKDLEYNTVRDAILSKKKRIDGRGPKDIRPIMAEVGVLPRAHGSSLFTRGETQALGVTTLGTSQDEQLMDELSREYKEHFMLHYNFPPYAVGEAGRMSSPGRREIGHGKLAWRAIRPMLPGKEDFPYTIRVVSEVLECNGSSSMATVCAASLSLMDAGVPLASPVAGIAMGLVTDPKNDCVVLSDILGDEDFLGDMDFKVAGTKDGITALQMDIKITSITKDIMKTALAQAKEGRLHILKEMSRAIDKARTELSDTAPRMETIKINKDKIREVIGSGGKVIREIVETTGAKVDIDDDGTVRVSAIDRESITKAIDWIKSIAVEPEVGDTYNGKVVKIIDAGAFVNFMGNRDGFVHISELAHRRVKAVGDVVTVGEMVDVKVLGFDDRGKIRLSIKALLPKDDE